MKLAKMYCVHPTGSEKVLLVYRKCWKCERKTTAIVPRLTCMCGSTQFGPVMEDCICPHCDTRWTRVQGAGGEDV